MQIRDAFIDSAVVARDVLRSPTLVERWDEPSALERMSVGTLAGHLVRAVSAVDDYLGRDQPPPGRRLTAAEYYLSLPLDDDLDSALHVGVRERAATMAADGPEPLRRALEATLERVEARLAIEPPDRAVAVFGDLVLALDEYLVTRMVEIAVHTDDLAVSLDVETPEVPAVASACVLGALLAVSRGRHGDLAVVRAFTRRERDDVDALRVF